MPVQPLTLDDVRVGDAAHDADLPQDPLGQHGGAQDVGDSLRKGQSRGLFRSRVPVMSRNKVLQVSNDETLANQGIIPMYFLR
jgi:hypothetical protein